MSIARTPSAITVRIGVPVSARSSRFDEVELLVVELFDVELDALVVREPAACTAALVDVALVVRPVERVGVVAAAPVFVPVAEAVVPVADVAVSFVLVAVPVARAPFMFGRVVVAAAPSRLAAKPAAAAGPARTPRTSFTSSTTSRICPGRDLVVSPAGKVMVAPSSYRSISLVAGL